MLSFYSFMLQMLRIYRNESAAPEPTEDRLDDLKPALPDLAEARQDGLHRGGGDSGNIFGILSAADTADAILEVMTQGGNFLADTLAEHLVTNSADNVGTLLTRLGAGGFDGNKEGFE